MSAVWGGLCSSPVLGAAWMGMVGLSDLSDPLSYKSTPILIFRDFYFFLIAYPGTYFSLFFTFRMAWKRTPRDLEAVEQAGILWEAGKDMFTHPGRGIFPGVFTHWKKGLSAVPHPFLLWDFQGGWTPVLGLGLGSARRRETEWWGKQRSGTGAKDFSSQKGRRIWRLETRVMLRNPASAGQAQARARHGLGPRSPSWGWRWPTGELIRELIQLRTAPPWTGWSRPWLPEGLQHWQLTQRLIRCKSTHRPSAKKNKTRY